MFDEIREIIRKNLPAEVGDALKRHLSDAEGWKRENDSMKAIAADNSKVIESLRGEVKDLKAVVKTKAELDARELDLEKRERNIELALAHQKSDLQERRVSDMKELVGMAFRNPSLKFSEWSTLPGEVDQYGTPRPGKQGPAKGSTTDVE